MLDTSIMQCYAIILLSRGNKSLYVISKVLIIVSTNAISSEVVATALGSGVNWVSWASLTDKVPFKF